MRPYVAGLAVFLASATTAALVAAAPAADWTRHVTQTAKGAFVLGNPAAPIKLVEYGSYTCSHCAAFSKE
ncbi:DsbA family protein, partial [Escherichia coli]|nr:DsbA family protein [Escherichia coli]